MRGTAIIDAYMTTQKPTFVLDNSVTMAWFFEDEKTPYTENVGYTIARRGAYVPSLWYLEVTNSLLNGMRQKRCHGGAVIRFMDDLRSFPIITDNQTDTRAFNLIFTLAREYNLTAYDASYLELAMRRGLPLATLDEKLKNAAKEAGVKVYVD